MSDDRGRRTRAADRAASDAAPPGLDLRPPPRARAARRLARHGRRHPADPGLHRGQRARRPADRHLGRAGRRALLVFLLRLVRRESVQQAVSGLFAVGIAVAIAAASGQARDFFVLGIVRNAAIAVVLLGSIAAAPAPGRRDRRVPRAQPPRAPWPAHSLPGHARPDRPGPGRPAPRRRRDPGRPAGSAPDPEPERPWREDPRLLRAYGWLTVLWGVTFLLRVAGPGAALPGQRRHDARHRVARARAAAHRRRDRRDPVGGGPAAPAPLPAGDRRPSDAGCSGRPWRERPARAAAVSGPACARGPAPT